jgi:RNA polymerase sigma-70 factor (ECF subfamily)
MTDLLLSEVLGLYHRQRDLHRESLAITSSPLDSAAGTPAWDWAGLRTRCVIEASRVLPRMEAEEAAQEALVRAWLRRDSCRSPGTPLPWLLEITRNEARRLLARRARRRSHELATEIPLDPDCEDSDLVGTALRVSVEQALDTLADGDRRLLRLRYAEDLTQSEVARRLGVPEGTVKVRLHRVRRRLRGLLAE